LIAGALSVLPSVSLAQENRNIFSTDNGNVSFRSDAPLELIDASSDKLRAVIDPDKRTFAFRVVIRTFKGFNGELQREHFNENYMEIDKFPEATFTGKIIEQVDLTKDGVYSVRAKGALRMHGVEQERIIKSLVTVKSGIIQVHSVFNVLLVDHDIKIPKVVHEKIASEIFVDVNADFKKK